MPFWFNPRICRLFWAVTLVAVPIAASGAELLPWRLPPIAMSTSKRLPDVARLPERAPTPIVDRLPERELIPSINPVGMLRSGVVTDWNDTNTLLPAAAEQSATLVRHASTLAGRGALYSARHDLEGSLLILSQALDAFHATTEFTRCLREGLWAMEEASDFSPTSATQRMTIDVGNTILKHRSKIIVAQEAARLSPLEAERKYYTFAQEHLAAAVCGSHVGAHAIYGIGKLYIGMSQLQANGDRLYGPRAMMMQQTALLVDHSHGLAANELGVLLARSGRLREACDMLRHGAANNGPPDTWRNLADVYDRLGAMDLAQHARVEWQRSAQFANSQSNPVVTAPNGLTIRWVDKITFERGSSGSTAQPMVPAPTLTPEPTPPTRYAGRPMRFAW